MFNIQPGQQFIIDGKSKSLTDLTPGTFLTARRRRPRSPSLSAPRLSPTARCGGSRATTWCSHSKWDDPGVHGSRLVYVHL